MTRSPRTRNTASHPATKAPPDPKPAASPDPDPDPDAPPDPDPHPVPTASKRLTINASRHCLTYLV